MNEESNKSHIQIFINNYFKFAMSNQKPKLDQNEKSRKLDESHYKIPVRVRLKKSGSGRNGRNGRGNGDDIGVAEKLREENQKLKESICSLSTINSIELGKENISGCIDLLIVKHENQLKSKQLQIRTLNRKLRLALSHLSPYEKCATQSIEQQQLDEKDDNSENLKKQLTETRSQLERVKMTNEKLMKLINIDETKLQGDNFSEKNDSEVDRHDSERDASEVELSLPVSVWQENKRLYEKIEELQSQISILKGKLKENVIEVEDIESSFEHKLQMIEMDKDELMRELRKLQEKEERTQSQYKAMMREYQEKDLQSLENDRLKLEEIQKMLIENCPQWLLTENHTQLEPISEQDSDGKPDHSQKIINPNNNPSNNSNNNPKSKRSKKSINILSTLMSLIETYDEQNRQYIQMQEYIQEIKNDLSNKEEIIFSLHEENQRIQAHKQLNQNAVDFLEMKRVIEDLEKKCQILEEENVGYESKLALLRESSEIQRRSLENAYLNQSRESRERENLFMREKVKQKQESLESESPKLEEQDVDDSFATHSDHQLSKIKIIYDAAQKSLEQKNFLMEKNKILNQQANQLEQQLTKMRQQLEMVKLHLLMTLNRNINDKTQEQEQEQEQNELYQRKKANNMSEELISLIEENTQKLREQFQERESQFEMMISQQLYSIFGENVFKQAKNNNSLPSSTLNEKLHRIKQIFTKNSVHLSGISQDHQKLQKVEQLLLQNQQQIERIILVNSDENNYKNNHNNNHNTNNEMDLTQAKIYLNQLQNIIRRTKKKYEQDTLKFQNQRKQNWEVQENLILEIKDISSQKQSLKSMLYETLGKLENVKFMEEVEEIVQTVALQIDDYEYQDEMRERIEMQGESKFSHRDQRLLFTPLESEEPSQLKIQRNKEEIQSLKQKYFHTSNPYIDHLTQKITVLVNRTTTKKQEGQQQQKEQEQEEQDLTSLIQSIFQILFENQQKNRKEEIRKKQIMRERSERINQMCQKSLQPNFGEDLKDSRGSVRRSRMSRSSIFPENNFSQAQIFIDQIN